MCFSRCNSLNLTGLMLTKGDIKISCLIWLIVSYDASCEGYLDTVMIINAKLLVLSPGRAVWPGQE